jgi:hypothetical protein
MTPLLGELADALPVDVQVDGELVALDESGRPDFHRLSARMLHKRGGIDVTLFVFDVLAVADYQRPCFRTGTGACCSRRSWSSPSACGSWARSRTARHYSRLSAPAASRVWWRSDCATGTGLAMEGGSRRRIGLLRDLLRKADAPGAS